MRILAAILALAAGCGGPMTPPRGPAHTPVNSPEAASACPDQRDAAKTAREDLLERQGGPEQGAASSKAARAVLAHAECEHRAFEALSIDAGTQAAMMDRVKTVRRQYQDARNLYAEADGYGDAAVAVGAGARLADLHVAFAAKLAALTTPVDLVDPAGRAQWRDDMRELVASFEVEAALAASRALDAADRAGDGDEVAAWVKSACEKVAKYDPDGLPRFARCR